MRPAEFHSGEEGPLFEKEYDAQKRLERRRTLLTQGAAWVGFAAVVLSIGLAFVPGAGIADPVAFEAKVVGGVVGFMGIGFLLVRRSTSARVATVAPKS